MSATRFKINPDLGNISLDDLLDRLADDAAYLSGGHTPRSPDDARSIGVELMELIRRVRADG